MDKKRNRDVWVFAEQRNSELHDVSLELLGKARELADRAGGKIAAVLMGCQIRGISRTLINHGADTVYVADDPELENYRLLPYTHVFENLIKEHKPDIVLVGANCHGGRNLRHAWRQDSEQGFRHIVSISNWTNAGICCRWCPDGVGES